MTKELSENKVFLVTDSILATTYDNHFPPREEAISPKDVSYELIKTVLIYVHMTFYLEKTFHFVNRWRNIFLTATFIVVVVESVVLSLVYRFFL